MQPTPRSATALRKRLGQLRFERSARDMTMEFLSAETGIDRATLSRIERGLQDMRQYHAEKLAPLFGVDAATLLKWAPKRDASPSPSGSPEPTPQEQSR